MRTVQRAILSRLSVGGVALILIALSIVDRFIRITITSDRSPYWWDMIGSFLIGEERLQVLFWMFPHSMFLNGATGMILVLVMIQTIRWMCAHDQRALVGLAIVLGGGNNYFDRWKYGGVWDYWVIRTPWSALWFNIADVMIVIAVFYFFIHRVTGAHRNKLIQ